MDGAPIELRIPVTEIVRITFPDICARSGKRARTKVKTVSSRTVDLENPPKGFSEVRRQSRPLRIRIPATWSRKIGRPLLTSAGLVGIMVGPIAAIIGLIDKARYVFGTGATMAVVGIAFILYAQRLWITGRVEGEELIMVGVSDRFAAELRRQLARSHTNEPFN